MKRGSPSPQLELLVHIPKVERGRSISPSGKGSVHIPNKKGASPYPRPERCRSTSQTGKGPVHIPNRKGASPYAQLERGWSISQTEKGPVHIPNRKAAVPKAAEQWTKSVVAHKWAEWLHKPCYLGPKRFKAVDKIRSGPQVGRLVT